MANVYDYAHQMAKALKESPEFQSLQQAQKKVNAEETAKKMLDDVQRTQMELQLKQMQGQEPTEGEMERAQKLFQTVQLNPTIAQYLHAEQCFAVIMEDINKIIAEPLKELYPAESN